ncbi:MAG: ribonuclease Y [Patescibacteria group bacterium]|nr:ribonuclease Y [Patescibacteria group bacterium]
MWILIALYGGAVGIGIGFAVGYVVRKRLALGQIGSAEAQAEKIIKDADNESKKKVVEAKEEALRMIEDSKRQDEDRRKDLRVIQHKLEKGEQDFQHRMTDLQKRQDTLFQKSEKIEEVKKELSKAREHQVAKLEQIASLSMDEAKTVVLKNAEEIMSDSFSSRMHKLERTQNDELESRARNMLSLVISRVASSHCVDTTTTNVQLPNDDMKGRIIGKEGRNIKAIENLTGTEIIVDDTPETIVISGFSPIRRQVARLALEKLIEDGRIHPSKIEGAVESAKKSLAKDIKKAGEDALYEMGIPLTALDPKLIQILGRLKFRTSYGQNVLRHSVEVAQIATLLAQELGADVTACKRGGLLHDIGKAVDHDVQGAHPEIGYNILKKFNMPEDICYQALAHHEDNPKTLEAILVKSADAISGARPGARKATYENYIQRLEELEKTAAGFPGVEKAYAIQAGREVRVFVEPKEVDDFAAYRLAKDIAKKIESELTYPGEVKVNVIRETRVIEYAR